MAKAVYSDIWSLHKKGSIIFHLIRRDTDKNKQRVFSLETKNNVVIKQYIINNFKTKIS